MDLEDYLEKVEVLVNIAEKLGVRIYDAADIEEACLSIPQSSSEEDEEDNELATKTDKWTDLNPDTKRIIRYTKIVIKYL